MMLIIASKNPLEAVKYLNEHTNKNFCFKQLIELCQLLAGCGITDKMQPINQGRAIMDWILRNKYWVFIYFSFLSRWAKYSVKMKRSTLVKIKGVGLDLFRSIREFDKPITTAIFRYRKGYECEYESNSELPIDVAVEEYKKYIKYKFKKDIENAENRNNY